ncbi:hypothetical protein GQ44DRAFT_677767 [Phaeosphaeriaceae sp. PMI808]|nr:hypothetical protein GQ44DRAFT_677767 [Phaeosphaeriaceae sp. PMI808]
MSHFRRIYQINNINSQYGRRNGYAITIDSHRRNKLGVQAVNLRCAHSKARQSEATGRANKDGTPRKARTKKAPNCPWRAKLKRNNHHFVLEITKPHHTHPPEMNDLALPHFRKLSEAVRAQIKDWTLQRIALKDVMKNLSAQGTHCSQDNVQTIMQRVRRDELGGLNKVQALCKFLDNHEADLQHPDYIGTRY